MGVTLTTWIPITQGWWVSMRSGQRPISWSIKYQCTPTIPFGTLVTGMDPPASSHGGRSTNATVDYAMSFLTTPYNSQVAHYLRKLNAQNSAHRKDYQIKSLRCKNPPYKTKPFQHDIPMPSFVKSNSNRSTNFRPLVRLLTSCDMNTDSRDQNRPGQSRLNSNVCKVIRCVGSGHREESVNISS